MSTAGQEASKGPALSLEVVVENTLGLHARPAALFVRTASRFESDITIGRGGHVGDGKSIIAVLMLGAGPGTRLELSACGADAREALAALRELFRSGFGED
jgi:phosphocarrier protein